VVRRAGLSEVLLAPRDSFIIITSGSVVITHPALARASGNTGEVVNEPPVVSGEPEPGMCVLGRYIPCGDAGVRTILDWLGRFTLVIRNIGSPVYEPISDGLGSDYYCHHGHSALVIPVRLGGGKQGRVNKLPWKKACQVSVLTLHESFEKHGLGVRLE